jgi:protein-S-isoprenylcysteine O-methyltransferase Ste14
MNLPEHLVKWGLTGIIWTAWCALHSILNSGGLMRRIGLTDPRIGRCYRLVYVIVTVLSLISASWLTPGWQEMELWRLRGPLRVVQPALWSLAVIVFWLTFRFINVWHFLGLTALGIGRRPTDSQHKLITWGIYGVIRHPQSAAGLILLWTRDLTDTGLIVSLVLSLYLIIGARIEEKRLLAIFGEQYARYMSEVPRFFPKEIPSLRDLFRMSIPASGKK